MVVTFTEHDDNLCFFRCISWHESQTKAGLEPLTQRKFQQWVEYKSLNPDAKFLGVDLLNIPDLETVFK